MKTYSSSETTKASMINAAGELAAEAGFSNVSTRTVAQRANANIGSIHYHFGGKEGLFEAVVREAISGCMQMNYFEEIEKLGEHPDRSALARVLRRMVSEEIANIFHSGKPEWQFRVIYQLMQRDDHLFDLARQYMLEPEVAAMGRFFRLIDPTMDDDAVFLHLILLKMPIYAHVDYIKAIHKLMDVDHYSAEYLKKMEDLLVRQTQLLMGLPEEVENTGEYDD
jgi:AcrR family transcriptional regulator